MAIPFMDNNDQHQNTLQTSDLFDLSELLQVLQDLLHQENKEVEQRLEGYESESDDDSRNTQKNTNQMTRNCKLLSNKPDAVTVTVNSEIRDNDMVQNAGSDNRLGNASCKTRKSTNKGFMNVNNFTYNLKEQNEVDNIGGGNKNAHSYNSKKTKWQEIGRDLRKIAGENMNFVNSCGCKTNYYKTSWIRNIVSALFVGKYWTCFFKNFNMIFLQL